MSIHYHACPVTGTDLRIVPCGLVAIREGHAEHSWQFDITHTYWCEGVITVRVQLFKPGGKWYTEEWWRVPDKTTGAYDMEKSPDFHRIDNGAVLVESNETMGWSPHLFPSPGPFAGHKPGCR